MLNFLLKLLPEAYADAIRRLWDADFSAFEIVALVIEYRDGIVSVVDKLIDALRDTVSHKPAMKVAKACDPELARHLCATQCALIHALWEHHQTCHAAGCCVDHE